MPTPAPKIAPGYALTGKRAYLETGDAPTAEFHPDTPLGALAITAHSTFLVDWGDGTKTGPHSGSGGPWPNGTISHVYTGVGTYSVVVTRLWDATWQLAGESGDLGGLRTEGRIDQFPTKELQAVRNR